MCIPLLEKVINFMLGYITNGVGKCPSVYLNKVTFDLGLDRQLGILTCVTDFGLKCAIPHQVLQVSTESLAFLNMFNDIFQVLLMLTFTHTSGIGTCLDKRELYK